MVAPKAKRSTRYQKYLIQTCGCGGLWTNDRAMRAGCVCDGLRECGQPDAVQHRLYSCQLPRVVDAREASG
eukprot:9501078-Pyramimonas_sp.AAC.1